MKRKDFFKVLGVGALAAVIAPKLLVSTEDSVPDIVDNGDKDRRDYLRENPRTVKESFQWHEQGRIHNTVNGRVILHTSSYDIKAGEKSATGFLMQIKNSEPLKLRINDVVLCNGFTSYISHIEPQDKSIVAHVTPYNANSNFPTVGDDFMLVIVSTERGNYAEQV